MDESVHAWQILDSEVVYSARPFLEIERQRVLLPDGRQIEDFHQAWVTDYAIIYAETEGGDVVMVRLYKHGARAVGLMFPGGGIHAGEQSLEAAQRELLEETGYVSDDWALLKKLVVHANYGCGQAYYFHAKRARRVAAPSHDDLEVISVELHPRQSLAGLLDKNEIVFMDCVAMLALVPA
ncbi:MAG: NUDIX hydrolase [Verrucomicrobiota bacterium]|nr:NUDIX hydrolase [Verrucomicrobiota bacterium]